MKTCEKVESKDDLWEVMSVGPAYGQITIRNLADYGMNPKVSANAFDSSLVRKVL